MPTHIELESHSFDGGILFFFKDRFTLFHGEHHMIIDLKII